MEDTHVRPARNPRTSALGDGLYREKNSRKLNWSHDWALVERRPPAGPRETFEALAYPPQTRKGGDKPRS